MHGMSIMYTDPYDREHQYPEAFDASHNGDFSGDVLLSIEDWRVELIYEADSQFARHGNAIVEVKLPFAVIAEIVAKYVMSKKVRKLEQADWREILS